MNLQQLELQPVAQVHPELQLQGNSHRALRFKTARTNPVEAAPYDGTPSMAWLHMAHVGELPPIRDPLDFTAAENLHLLTR